MKTFTLSLIALSMGLGTVAGCGHFSDHVAAATHQHHADASKVLLTDEPEGAMSVSELRLLAQDGDEVVLIGRIGGASEPWVADRSAFSVVDPSVELCEDGVCACCKDEVCDATALIKVVDEHGHLFKTDTRELLNVNLNELVVVSGKAKRDDSGNLTILASGVYVRR